MLGILRTRELFVAGISGFVVFCTAVTYTWSSPLIRSFRSPGSTLYLTSTEVAFLSSTCDIASVVACFPAAYASDFFGRRPLVWMTAPVVVVSWFVLLVCTNKTALFSIRFIQGLMLGVQNTVVTYYTAEIISPDIRGNVISYTNVTWHAGTLYIYLVGTFCGFVGLTWFTLMPNLVLAVLFFWFPESPYYLVMKGKREQAVRVLVWFRGGTATDSHIVEEIQLIDETIEHEKSISTGPWMNLFLTKKGRKSLFIVELVTIVYAMGGTNTIPVYASDTIAQLSGNEGLANVITVILGVLLVLVVLPSIFLTDKWGRRPLLLLSMAGSAILFVPTSILLYLIQKRNVTAISVKTSCYVFLVLAMSFAALGVETIQPVLSSEFFPTTSRSVSSGGTSTLIMLLQSLSCYLYECIDNEVGIYLNYVVFLIVTLVGLIGVYILMPETKCKTFAEIQSAL